MLPSATAGSPPTRGPRRQPPTRRGTHPTYDGRPRPPSSRISPDPRCARRSVPAPPTGGPSPRLLSPCHTPAGAEQVGNSSDRLLFSDHACGLERVQFRLGVAQKISVNFLVVFSDAWGRLVKADGGVGENDWNAGTVDLGVRSRGMVQADSFSSLKHARITDRRGRIAHFGCRHAGLTKRYNDLGVGSNT